MFNIKDIRKAINGRAFNHNSPAELKELHYKLHYLKGESFLQIAMALKGDVNDVKRVLRPWIKELDAIPKRSANRVDPVDTVERYNKIYELVDAGKNKEEIARAVGMHVSSIWRIIKLRKTPPVNVETGSVYAEFLGKTKDLSLTYQLFELRRFVETQIMNVSGLVAGLDVEYGGHRLQTDPEIGPIVTMNYLRFVLGHLGFRNLSTMLAFSNRVVHGSFTQFDNLHDADFLKQPIQELEEFISTIEGGEYDGDGCD